MLFSVPASLLLAIAASPAVVADERLRGCARLSQDDKARLACFDALVPKTPATASPPAASKGKWQIEHSSSEMDDSKTVVISLSADRDITAWPGKTSRPTLIVRCKENKTEAYVVTGAAPAVEAGNLNGATVRIRLDDARVQSVSADKSTDGEALFFRSPFSQVGGWLGKSRMLFEFTPFNSNPQTVTFPIAGIDEAIKPLRAACGW